MEINRLANEELSDALNSKPTLTNTSTAAMPAGVDGKPQAPQASVIRQKQIGDIINFDGQLYRVRKFTGHHNDIVLRKMNTNEVNAFMFKRRMIQEEAIRRAKERITGEAEAGTSQTQPAGVNQIEDKNVVIEPPEALKPVPKI
jgi:hypothetical protein